ncbi:MAG: immunoglobulin-like domain-containing protein [Saccharofermentanales bacterium]
MMKNILFAATWILVLCLIQPLQLVAAVAGQDVTPPSIVSIRIIPDRARPGDVVSIIIKAQDSESGLPTDQPDTADYALFVYDKEDNSIFLPKEGNILLSYDFSTKEYKAAYKIPANAVNGEYFLYTCIFDKKGNSEFKTMDSVRMTIAGGSSDSMPPRIESLVMSPQTGKPGDLISITIKARDDGSGLPNPDTRDTIRLIHRTEPYKVESPHDPTGIELTYDASTLSYKASFILPDNAVNGDYKPYIQIYDKIGNYYPDLIEGYYFTVAGGSEDFTPPKTESITFSKNTVQPKDIVEITVVARDDGTGLEVSPIFNDFGFEHELYGIGAGIRCESPQKLLFDEASGSFKATFTIPVNTPCGVHIPYTYIRDKQGNMACQTVAGAQLSVLSIFQYDNEPVSLGSTFNPLKNVTAISSYEGDITDKIEYTGTVDTGRQGFNLIQYSVIGKDGDRYIEYRWVTVLAPGSMIDENGEIYTSKPVEINTDDLDDSEAMLKRGSDAEILTQSSTVIDEEGKYELSIVGSADLNNSNITNLSYMLASNPDSVDQSGTDQMDARPLWKASFKSALYASAQPVTGFNILRFTIDRTKPEIFSVKEGGVYLQPVLIGFSEGTAKLNGKSYQSGAKISMPGSYMIFVEDKAGNSSSVNFKVVKSQNETVSGSSEDESDINIASYDAPGESSAIDQSIDLSDSGIDTSNDKVASETNGQDDDSESRNVIIWGLAILVFSGAGGLGLWYWKKRH